MTCLVTLHLEDVNSLSDPGLVHSQCEPKTRILLVDGFKNGGISKEMDQLNSRENFKAVNLNKLTT